MEKTRFAAHAETLKLLQEIFVPDALSPEEIVKHRQQEVDDYLICLSEQESRTAAEIASQIHNPDKPLAKTLAIIPVAAHQESKWIDTALGQFNKQTTQKPYSIILGLNTPIDKLGSEGTWQTINEVSKAQQKYPNLDIRAALFNYDEPVIGQVRRDLWNGTLVAANKQGSFQDAQDVIGINLDIDIEWMAHTYISRVQSSYSAAEKTPNELHYNYPSSTRTRHGVSPNHPNVSKVITWLEYAHSRTNTTWEAGHVIPLSFYVAKKGIPSDRRTHEVGKLTAEFLSQNIAGTGLHFSPRRYVDKLGHHGYNIWATMLTANDECRTNKDTKDITPVQADSIINSTQRMLFMRALAPMAFSAYAALRKELHDSESHTEKANLVYEIMQPKSTKLGKEMRSVLQNISGSILVEATASAVFTKSNVMNAIHNAVHGQPAAIKDKVSS